MNVFERCVLCYQAPLDHLHDAECHSGNQSKHHAFRPDSGAIAVELERIAPHLAKSEAYDLIAAITSALGVTR